MDQLPPPPAADPATPPTAAPSAAFVKVRNPSGRAYLLTAVALAVLLTLFSGLYAVQSLLYDPERVVAGYFSALSDRDAAAARSFLEEPASESPDEPTDLPLIPLAAPYQPPSEVEVTSIEEMDEVEMEGGPIAAKGDWRSAKVTFKLGDRTHQVTLYLHRQEKKEMGLFRSWLISGGVSQLTVPVQQGSPDVLINGQAVPARAGYASARVFPGVYEVRLADNPLLEAQPVTVEVDLTQPGDVRLTTTVKASALSEVESQVKAYLDECAKSTELSPEGCPFSMYSFGTATNVKWTINTYPTLDLRMNNGRIAVGTRTTGRASVTWTSSGGTTYDDDETRFRVSGYATLVDGKVTFQHG